MIIRILGGGQYRLAEHHLDELNVFDAELEAAVNSGDQQAVTAALAGLTSAVERLGEEVNDDDFIDSDLIVPHADATVAEIEDLFDDSDNEGLIPG